MYIDMVLDLKVLIQNYDCKDSSCCVSTPRES